MLLQIKCDKLLKHHVFRTKPIFSEKNAEKPGFWKKPTKCWVLGSLGIDRKIDRYTDRDRYIVTVDR